MSEKKFVVKHHLDQLSPEELAQYLRDVSTFIKLDPDLNGLDTIWLDNESGVGRSLVPYAKRGTAEILRNIYEVDVQELSHTVVKGSIVFTAAGKNGKGRVERAIGSKYIEGLTGKALDNAIMTASTRALRRLTMQFTTLGILDESEIVDIVGQNPASSAQLSGSPIVIPPPPQVPANNAPGKENVAPPVYPEVPTTAKVVSFATAFPTEAPQDKLPVPPSQVANAEAALKPPAPADIEPDKKAEKKSRKKKNTVSLEVEPEVVQTSKPSLPGPDAPENLPVKQSPSTAALPPLPSNPPSVPPPQPAPQPQVDIPVAPVAGMPSPEQMIEYRKKISVFTQQLPATPGLGSVQRMRAFITRMSDGVAPQDMNVKQWEKLLAFFDDFVGRNGVKNLIIYIGDLLGDIPKK